MADDPEGLVRFEAAGKMFTAVFGFRAMKAVEAHYDLPFFKALQRAMPSLRPEDAADPVKIAEAGASVSMTAVGKLFECALLKHHPDLTEADIEDMVDELGLERVGAILGDSVSAALVKDKEGDGKSAANPPRSRSRKTG